MDRLQPLQIAEAGRGAKCRDRLTMRAARVVLATTVLDQQPHPDAGRMPAGGGEPPERRPRRGRLVEMKRLRIEAGRKRLDRLGGEGIEPDVAALADLDVLVEFHAGASSPAA